MNEPAVLLRRSYAQLFAQAALVSVEREIDELSPASSINIIGASPSQEQSALHSKIPIQLDPILALVVLAMYEYCQRGNVSRMRARVNHAVTTAMDLCLHDLGSTSTEYSEAQRRAWWMIVSDYFPRFVIHCTNCSVRCLWHTYPQTYILRYSITFHATLVSVANTWV